MSTGSVLFRLQIFDRDNMEGKTWLTFPASVAMDYEASEITWIRYTWFGADEWRVDIMDADRALIRSIVCDGKNVDTGDAIWDGRFHTDYSGGILGSTYRGLTWPYLIVSGRHLFPISLGKDWSAHEWFSSQVIESIDPPKDEENGFVHMQIRDNHPSFVAIESADERVKDWVRYANADSVARLPVGSDILIFDSKHGQAPVLWQQSYGGCVVETFEWSEPIAISDNTWIHRFCSKSVPEGSTEKVWTCEIVYDESEFGMVSMKDPFVIRDASTKPRVLWPKE